VLADLKSRELFHKIKTEYENTLTKLLPLKEKLRKTDWLVDHIVFKLYSLTADDISIIAEKVSLPLLSPPIEF
jgi:hypothetical protein